METSRTPDRLYASTNAKILMDKIDDQDFMHLGKTSINRSELFAFAMALGVETNSQTQVVNPYAGGLILDKSIDSRTKALIYCQFINSLSDLENDLDYINDRGNVYKMAEQYANTGFEIIDDYMKTKKQSEIILSLLIELNKQYSDLNVGK